MIGTSSTPLGAARERQRGQILVLFAFVLIALLLVSALAVDYGGWLLARRGYQHAADEAASAGAYLITSQISDICSVSQPTKNVCAR
jgi:Flp pilus assembly protein TadG